MNGTISFNIGNDLEIENPLRVFFLCGSSFDAQNSDKRVVLRDTIESIDEKNYKALILEDHFIFNNRSTRKINYNLMGLKSLKDIEIMTSFLSDKIVILHESISTAAEIGLFSHRQDMLKKMLLLIPDELSSEENFFSGFLRLSYSNPFLSDYNIDHITYYPELVNYNQSDNVKKFHSQFYQNTIGEQLLSEMKKLFPSEKLKIPKLKKKQKFYSSQVNYYTENKQIFNVFLTPETLKAMFISLFSVGEIRKKLRTKMDFDYNPNSMKDKVKVVNHNVNILKEYFRILMIRTLSEDVGTEVQTLNIKIINSEADFNTSFQYLLYLFDAFKLISIVSEESRPYISISSELSSLSDKYKILLRKVKKGITLEEVLADE